MLASKHQSLTVLSSSANPAFNPIDSHFIDERSESLTSFTIKDDHPLSVSSDEAKNSAMEILDNLIEKVQYN